jgi:hypothetical protein
VRKWIKRYNEINKKECPICGDEIWNSAKMCKICSNIRKRKYERPEYETLKKDVDELGYILAAKKNGVVFRTLKRWINDYEKLAL